MIISEFGYQRAVGQVEKVSDLCRQASLQSQSPHVLRYLREIRNEAEVVKEILAGEVKPDPVKPPRVGKLAMPSTAASDPPSDDPVPA